MKVDKITLSNFRSAKELTVEFNPRLNVFVGINGSGKTTILDALANSLSWLVNRTKKIKSRGLQISESDIRYNSNYSYISINCKNNYNMFSWLTVKDAEGITSDLKSDYNGVTELAYLFQEILREHDKLPVVAYYPVYRNFNKTTLDNKNKKTINIFDIYDNCLGNGINYQTFFEWFKMQDDIINERAMSRSQWIKKNYNYYHGIVNVNLDVLFNIVDWKSDDTDNKRFNEIARRLSQDKQIYEDPNILIQELTRLYSTLKFRANDDFIINVFSDLDIIFYKMEKFSNSYKENLTKDNSEFENLIIRVINDFKLSFEHNQEYKSFLDVFWRLIIIVNELCFWWFSKLGLKKLHNHYLNFIPAFNTDKESFKKQSLDFVQIITSFMNDELKLQIETVSNDRHEIKSVTKAIEQFLPDYTGIRITRIPRPHMLINKGDQEFDINHLSDGEKNLITLVGDIARRLAIANPRSSDPLKGEGIILIDEIDLHLHPKWQRIMIPQLLKTFSNCQFIVTTHSPQVISHVQPENLFILNNENNELSVSKATESYGKNSDRILEDLLGVEARPKEIKDDISKLYRLISDGELEEAKKEVDRLSKIIVGGDPELSKANVLIKRKKIIGK